MALPTTPVVEVSLKAATGVMIVYIIPPEMAIADAEWISPVTPDEYAANPWLDSVLHRASEEPPTRFGSSRVNCRENGPLDAATVDAYMMAVAGRPLRQSSATTAELLAADEVTMVTV